MSDDTPPDRLSSDPASPYYDAALLERGVGVRFKGVDRNNVEEYCVSEKLGPPVSRHDPRPQGPPLDHQAAGRGRALFPRQDGRPVGRNKATPHCADLP